MRLPFMRPVSVICTSLLFRMRLPSLPLVMRTRWTEDFAADAILLYNSEALAESGRVISSGRFLSGLPRGVMVRKRSGEDIEEVVRVNWDLEFFW